MTGLARGHALSSLLMGYAAIAGSPPPPGATHGCTGAE
jgi:hypothetical protein